MQSKKIFVIGSGRSGTHWLGYLLDSHPKIAATIEKPFLFKLVTRTAMDQTRNRRWRLALLRLLYRIEHARVVPMHYADKSHPNIWLAEDLMRSFSDARFVGIQRNPYATVSSMLQHNGVRRWCERWDEYPIPNPFLGITHENKDTYERMSMAGRCAMRWLSHRDRLEKLEKEYPEKVLVIQYERLMLETKLEIERLREHLDLEEPFPFPEIRTQSFDKWSEYLLSDQIDAIEQVTGISPECCRIDAFPV